MRRRSLIITSLILLAVILPIVWAPRPPPSWPPDEIWKPVSIYDVRPDVRRILAYPNRDVVLDVGEPFYIAFGWWFASTDLAYDADTGNKITISTNLLSRSKSLNVVWTMELDGVPLKPTYSYKGSCTWFRFWNSNTPVTQSFPYGEWAIAPKANIQDYGVVFPDGLSAGDHVVHTHISGTRSGLPSDFYVTLHFQTVSGEIVELVII